MIFADPAFALSTDLGGESVSTWRAGFALAVYAGRGEGDLGVFRRDDACSRCGQECDDRERRGRAGTHREGVAHRRAWIQRPGDPFLVGLGLQTSREISARGLLDAIGAVRYERAGRRERVREQGGGASSMAKDS